MMDDNKEARDILDHLGMLEDQRRRVDLINQDVSRFILPGHGWWPSAGVNTVRGEERADDRLDGTGTFALRVLAAGQQGGMASPTSPWFRLALEDDRMMDLPGAKWWLTEVETRMYATLARSRFYQAVHQFYLELDAFGTGCVYQDIDKQGNLIFNCLTFGEYCIALNEYGVVDTVFRRFPITARGAVRWFGKDKVSHETKRLAEKTPYEEIEIVHVVRPRDDLKPGKIDKMNMPFESIYLEYGQRNTILRKGGYRSFPFHVARYNESGGEPYGRGPGHDAMPTCKELMDMSISKAMLVHRLSDEPVQTDAQTANNIDTTPGAINVGQGKLEPVYARLQDPTPIMTDIADKRKEIRNYFHNDIFLLDAQGQGQPMTATEVMERKAEKLLMLGPSTERQQSEFFDPCIDRTFELLWGAGKLPEIPPRIAQTPYKVTYVSILARAQRAAGKTSIRDVVAFVLQLVEAQSDAVDNLAVDSVIKEYVEISDVPSDILTEADQRAKIRGARAEQLASQQAAAEAVAATGAVKDLAGAKTGERNALTDTMAAMGAR